MTEFHRKTPKELRVINENNYHGAIGAIFAGNDPDPSVRTVIEVLERRFGMTNEVTGQLTTIEVTEMLVAGLAAAREHLRPDTIDWYNQRVDYLLACAEARTKPE